MLQQLITLFAILAAFGTNVWSNVAPANGESIGEIANTRFGDVLITPANYAFIIWGVIYLGLMCFAIYQLLPAQRTNLRLRQLGYAPAIASAAQIAWVQFFLTGRFDLSLLAMLAILLALIWGYLRAGIGSNRPARLQRWLVCIPMSTYLGWISVATVANVATVLYERNWTGWGISPAVWTVVVVLLSGAIAAIVTLRRHDVAFPLVFVWASVAIAVRNHSVPSIAWTAGGLAIALVVLLLFRWVPTRRLSLPDQRRGDRVH
ncbi:hypothetical protein KR51_00015490 [Rubidibacter lacunae KORDI 51-2]|uniref:Tryptophan-rich sensory protein n=1 Tax=Rubidibacter lacunae KORDI 51-2 TaxID=582515 RepID=U5DJ46_9CHRO|nr:hypothetical protein [Rubidibacter lacunae]ERN41706.1 hypothetical protein KR51_00015490 [Rubidibacter lacunae KORDI 51-2]